MNAILDEMESLPPGLWVVKWVDLFELAAMKSPSVSVLLQRLFHKEVTEVEQLSQKDVGYVLGRSPDEPLGWSFSTEFRSIFVGSLPQLSIGDLVRGNQIVGRMRQQEREFTLTEEVGCQNLFLHQEHPPPPPGWHRHFRHLVLNPFEFDVKGEVAAGSRCLCIRSGEDEYLIPATVVFKTFYGFHSHVANAFCKGAWDRTCSEVISTGSPTSGLGTYIDEHTGAWNILVRQGLTREHAMRLAPLLFDAHARSRANEVYSQSLVQTGKTRSDGHRKWHVYAGIPYRWNDQPLTLRVHGFPLRPYDPSLSPRWSRFLVTRIDATSWPFPDQVIAFEREYSNAESTDPNPERVDRPFRTWTPAPVPAATDAQITHSIDPRTGSAQNLFHADEFKFIGPHPEPTKQVKKTHKEFPAHSGSPAEPPDPLLSAGNPAPGKHRPGQLVAETSKQRHWHKLRFMLNALDSLMEGRHITGYEVVSPPPDPSHLRLHRDGIPCWSLLTDQQTRWLATGAQRRPRGWEYIFHTTNGHRQANARSVLVLRIHRGGRQIVLFEIEARSSERFFSYACAPTKDVTERSIASVLQAIRNHEGRLPSQHLGELFGELTGGRPLAIEHRYLSDKGSKQTTGIKPDWLLSRLDLVLSQG